MYKLIFAFLILNISIIYSLDLSGKSGKAWMLDEHTYTTLAALDSIKILDPATNKVVLWNNNVLKLIIISTNLLTDIWDKGQSVTELLFDGPRVIEMFMNLSSASYKEKKMKRYIPEILIQSSHWTRYFNIYIEDKKGFNQYPLYMRDSVSRTQGFHFDNLFMYDTISARWDSINSWVKQKGIEFRDSVGIRRWFVLMGLMSHAVQDFYCHSNWVLINGKYGYDTPSLNGDKLPTWEEFNDQVWLDAHKDYNRQRVLDKLKESNNKISDSEFVYKGGICEINGGLQTGNCVNKIRDYEACNYFTCSKYLLKDKKVRPWGHRHPGNRSLLHSDDKTDCEECIVSVFNNDVKSANKEYSVSLSLSLRATVYWFRHLLDSAIIGDAKFRKIAIELKKPVNEIDNYFTNCPYYIIEEFRKVLALQNKAVKRK